MRPNGELSQESVLYTFCSRPQCADGNRPAGGVFLDAAGNLFGTTTYGGNAADSGVLYELSDGTYTVLHKFCLKKNCTDGSFPVTNLIGDGAGALYGTTKSGGKYDMLGGTVFQLKP